jgi:hypothetical protein
LKEEAMTHKSWRDVITVHPAADLFPMLDGGDLEDLAKDIAANGLRQPVMFIRDDDGNLVLLDGRNRIEALQLLGAIKVRNGKLVSANVGDAFAFNKWQRVIYRDECGDPYAYVTSLNLHRRHLTMEQKRAVIAKMLAANPEMSDRRIGKVAHVDGKTVAGIRTDMEERAEIPHVAIRQDVKGRQQPAQRATADTVDAAEVYDMRCVEQFRLGSHEQIFRKMMLSPSGRRFFTKDQQLPLAEQLRAEIERAEGGKGDLRPHTVREMVGRHLSQAMGFQRKVDEEERQFWLAHDTYERVKDRWTKIRRHLEAAEAEFGKLIKEKEAWTDSRLFPVDLIAIDRIILTGKQCERMKRKFGR